jgi:hypothetical protein
MPDPQHPDALWAEEEMRGEARWMNPSFWVELFLVSNIAFLALDIFLAHSVNAFEHRAEWIPIVFSVSATVLLLITMFIRGLLTRSRTRFGGFWYHIAGFLSLAVGWGSIVVGIAGLLWHLNATFFQEQTLRSLVYTAPFAAPLAYTGLGLLLVMNRMVQKKSPAWPRWVLLLAAGGFAGNFVLSLADHAQNGFFYPTEWIGVVSGACATGFLTAAVIVPESLSLAMMNLALSAIQVAVGLFGFVLHLRANLSEPGVSLWAHFIYRAPIFAPLLFADLAVLAALGLWAQIRFLKANAQARTSDHPVQAVELTSD